MMLTVKLTQTQLTDPQDGGLNTLRDDQHLQQGRRPGVSPAGAGGGRESFQRRN